MINHRLKKAYFIPDAKRSTLAEGKRWKTLTGLPQRFLLSLAKENNTS